MEKTSDRLYRAKLSDKKEVSKETYEFSFVLEQPLSYRPGQYIWVVAPELIKPDPQGDRRAFSLTSIPNGENRITILFRSSASGYKQSLLAAPVGTELTISGPFGFAFSLPEDQTIPLLFMAGGTGIAPFLSLTKHLIANNWLAPVRVVYSDSSAERAAFTEEVKSWDKKTEFLRSIFLSRPPEWEDVEKMGISEKTIAFISGPQGFVDHASNVLKSGSFFEHQLRFEAKYPTAQSGDELQKLFNDNGQMIFGSDETDVSRSRGELVYNLMASSDTHTVVTDANGVIIFVNEAAQRITGYAASEILGQTPRLWGGLMPREFYEDLWQRKMSGKPFSVSLVTNRRKNGKLYYATAHISPIKSREGKITGFIANEEDITDRINLENQLETDKARSEAILLSVGEALVTTDVEGRVILVNRAFENMLGWKEDEIRGKNSRNSYTW